MGQLYWPKMHDPDWKTREGQDKTALSDKEIKLRFEALIAKIEATERRKRPAG